MTMLRELAKFNIRISLFFECGKAVFLKNGFCIVESIQNLVSVPITKAIRIFKFTINHINPLTKPQASHH